MEKVSFDNAAADCRVPTLINVVPVGGIISYKSLLPLSLTLYGQGCQMAKIYPFLSLDCARVEGMGGAIQGKQGIKFCSVA